MRFSSILATVALGSALFASAAERPVDPTFLYRRLSDAAFQKADVTTPTCRYRPLFGEGDSQTSIVKGVARYGEIVVDAGGECAETNYPAEEQIYFVLQGSGKVSHRGKTIQVAGPGMDLLRGVVEEAALALAGCGVLESESVFLVGPIECHEGVESGLGNVVCHGIISLRLRGKKESK